MMILRAANGATARTVWKKGLMSITGRFPKEANRMASTLVISEPLKEDGSTPAGTQSTVTAATKLNNGNDIHLLVVGGTSPSKIPEGVSKVYYVPIDDKLSETVANAVLEATTDDCNVVVGTASKFGSTVVPRVAALLDVSPITDILEIENESECSGIGLNPFVVFRWRCQCVALCRLPVSIFDWQMAIIRRNSKSRYLHSRDCLFSHAISCGFHWTNHRLQNCKL